MVTVFEIVNCMPWYLEENWFRPVICPWAALAPLQMAFHGRIQARPCHRLVEIENLRFRIGTEFTIPSHKQIKKLCLRFQVERIFRRRSFSNGNCSFFLESRLSIFGWERWHSLIWVDMFSICSSSWKEDIFRIKDSRERIPTALLCWEEADRTRSGKEERQVQQSNGVRYIVKCCKIL